MKIAVSYEPEDEFISQHFGKTEQFKLYEVEGDEVLSEEVVPAGGAGHEALAAFLKERGIDTVICGGIGAGMYDALSMIGIKVYGGIKGYADAAVQALMMGVLAYQPQATCHEHDDGHDCGCAHSQHDGGGCCCGS